MLFKQFVVLTLLGALFYVQAVPVNEISASPSLASTSIDLTPYNNMRTTQKNPAIRNGHD